VEGVESVAQKVIAIFEKDEHGWATGDSVPVCSDSAMCRARCGKHRISSQGRILVQLRKICRMADERLSNPKLTPRHLRPWLESVRQ